MHVISVSDIPVSLLWFGVGTTSLQFPSFSCLLQLSSCHAVLSTQLADAMMFPITQFKERDLKGRVLEKVLGLSTKAVTEMFLHSLFN